MFDYERSQKEDTGPQLGSGSSAYGLTSLPGILWRGRWPIILCPILFAAGTAVFSSFLPDRYQSMAQVLVDPRELRVLNNDIAPQQLSSDAIAAYIESLTRVITSTDMLRRIVEREKLTTDSEYASRSAVLQTLARLVPLGAKTDTSAARAAEQLRKNLWVRRGERTFVIDIAVTATTPEKSAQLSNAFAQAFLDEQADARSEQIRRASSSLSARLQELRERVRRTEDKVESYRAQKNLVGASGRLVSDEQLIALNNQLALARARASETKAKFDQISALRGALPERGSLPEAVASQTMGLLRQQVGEAQRRATSLAATLGPQHPQLLAAQSSLRDAQRAITDELTRIREAAKAELDRALANERSLQTQVDGLKKETLASGRDAVELRELERELEANRGVYQTFLQRARETSEQENLDTSNVRIITSAVPPLERVGPQRRAMVTIAAVVGLIVGLLLALGAEGWSLLRQRRDLSQVRRAAGQSPNPPASVPATAPEARVVRRATAADATDEDLAAEADLRRLLRAIGRLETAMGQNGARR